MQIVHRPFQWGGVSDEIEQNLWRHLAKSGSVQNVFDIGARNSIIPDIFNEATVYLFEPNPRTFIELQQQFQPISNIRLFPFGIGNVNETIPYYPNTESFIHRTIHIQSRDPVLLPIRSFESVVAELNIPTLDFIKIDTEGYEYAILKNAESYIRDKKIKFIQFEIGGTIFDIKENLFDIFSIFDASWTIYNMEPNVLNKMNSAFTWDPSDRSNSNLFATWIPESQLQELLK